MEYSQFMSLISKISRSFKSCHVCKFGDVKELSILCDLQEVIRYSSNAPAIDNNTR